MGYKIKQIRYSPSTQYIGNISNASSIEYVVTEVASGSGTGSGTVHMFNTKAKLFESNYLQDNKDYNLYVNIPRFSYEDTVVRLYLSNDAMTKQQYLGTYNIPQYGTSKNMYEVLMYENPTPPPAPTPPEEEEEETTPVEVDNTKVVVFKNNANTSIDETVTRTGDSSSYVYYQGQDIIDNYVLAPLIASWTGDGQQQEIGYYGIRTFFRPITTELNNLLIVIQRGSLDYSINTTPPNASESGFGRLIILDTTDVELSEINNLITGETISKLGIHARTGTNLMINGERMRVGRSGYFELDKVIDITSLGIYIPALDENATEAERELQRKNNFFVADYTYLTTS